MCSYEKAKTIARCLNCSVDLVRTAIELDEQYHHRHLFLLQRIITLEQAVNYLNKIRNDPSKGIEIKLVIKKVYQHWPESDQETIQKDGVSNETK